MTKMSWNRPGGRFYETGLDRGVLYLSAGSGIPWNGLVSVTEMPGGGEAKSFYIDGYKYLNVPGKEDFQGTIEAYTYPEEFEVCEGTKHLGRGLYFAQQRRQSFGFSYRNLIGNDLVGTDAGYKIHLIYNALAIPSDKTRATTSDDVNVEPFSWSITTKPIKISGHHPVPHVIIDSRKTSATLLAAFEDILYGSESANPRIPSPSEIITLFSEWPVMNVIDNGDGTFTVDGPDDIVSILSNTTFQINATSAIDDGDGTFTVSSL